MDRSSLKDKLVAKIASRKKQAPSAEPAPSGPRRRFNRTSRNEDLVPERRVREPHRLTDTEDLDEQKFRRKATMLMARNQQETSASSNPDPGRSVMCYECRVWMDMIHSHPWADPTRVKRGIGWFSEVSRPRSNACALCSIIEGILNANAVVTVGTGSSVGFKYRLQPTLLGSAYDRDPRRQFGQETVSTRRLYDRWGLGLEIKPPGHRVSSIRLDNVIHGAIRPLPAPIYYRLEEAPFETRPLLCGRSRPPHCDFRLLKTWIDLCDKHHRGSCIRRSNLRGTIRLIDTENQCLVLSDDVSSDHGYIALSYVWGDKEQSYAVSAESYAKLSDKGALLKLDLSRTVADAILLVQNLGFRYLWVDALCIRQDSMFDKHEQIAQMGFVYQSALFTIIAASGDDCDAGLPGVRPYTRTNEQKSVQSGNITLLSAFQSSIHTTKWARRGWTYQEELLSTRRLVFTRELVYWNCPSASWYEDLQFESSDRIGFMPPGVDVRPSLEEQYSNLKARKYFELVQEYARRELSYSTDALNAFSGILSMLTEYSGEQFFWGHMISDFERQLSWFGRAKERHVTRENSFPSWSWVSREGELSFDECETYHPAIACYTIKAGARGLTCSRINHPESSCVPKSLDSLYALPLEQVMKFVPASHLQPGFHLCFYTQRATFYLMPQGRLVLPGVPGTFWNNKRRIPRPEHGYLLPSLQGSDLCPKGYRECILLGHRPATSQFDDPHVLVMLIRRDEFGIAYREGLAVIPAEHWERSNQRRELIVLG
ncbi:uncharacterized protein HMPREF1541_09745 [Cyphellophora europaea CBS 101466]|uniref:Heterokaryon incompatibility domain-containing protein n=1 Tax=Cyphellophora europaea (strain CBS 101466) TaxID=1220924 RepID=W2S8C9_CYPE1|nr:uncharacterized protein HMPREF1541_09745 [Cyphellophora europaea CBS 101466]ETN44870.1 hypothetical protein HMPREF1541_09745 [Cyphellophora europaea CBS 101466]